MTAFFWHIPAHCRPDRGWADSVLREVPLTQKIVRQHRPETAIEGIPPPHTAPWVGSFAPRANGPQAPCSRVGARPLPHRSAASGLPANRTSASIRWLCISPGQHQDLVHPAVQTEFARCQRSGCRNGYAVNEGSRRVEGIRASFQPSHRFGGPVQVTVPLSREFVRDLRRQGFLARSKRA
jgi:hypothetical protein